MWLKVIEGKLKKERRKEGRRGGGEVGRSE
jgi:hypothetical protein